MNLLSKTYSYQIPLSHIFKIPPQFNLKLIKINFKIVIRNSMKLIEFQNIYW